MLTGQAFCGCAAQNYDYGCVSYDMIFLWMAAWFMLGRWAGPSGLLDEDQPAHSGVPSCDYRQAC